MKGREKKPQKTVSQEWLTCYGSQTALLSRLSFLSIFSGIDHVIRRSDPLLALAVFLSFRLRANSRVTGVQPFLCLATLVVVVFVVELL